MRKADLMRMRFVMGFMLPFACIFAEEAPQLRPVFDAGKGGYAFYRIPGIVVTAKGSVLAYCEARKNGASDWGRIDIMLRRGTNAATQWEPQRSLVELDPSFEKNPVALAKKLAKPEDITIGNPVAIACRNGTVLF